MNTGRAQQVSAPAGGPVHDLLSLHLRRPRLTLLAGHSLLTACPVARGILVCVLDVALHCVMRDAWHEMRASGIHLCFFVFWVRLFVAVVVVVGVRLLCGCLWPLNGFAGCCIGRTFVRKECIKDRISFLLRNNILLISGVKSMADFHSPSLPSLSRVNRLPHHSAHLPSQRKPGPSVANKTSFLSLSSSSSLIGPTVCRRTRYHFPG